MQKVVRFAGYGLAALTFLAGVSLFVPDIVRWMEIHQAISGWAQAMFSVIAILASAVLSVWVPARLRQLEKQDLCLRAMSLTVTSLEHSRKMLSTTMAYWQEHGLNQAAAAMARRELEVRLDEMSRIQVEALPEHLLHDLFGTRAQIRIFCNAFDAVENGKLAAEELLVQDLEAAIKDLANFEMACRLVLKDFSAKARQRGLLGSGRVYGSGVVGVIGTDTPTRPSRALA